MSARRCPYCLGPVDRPAPARYCDEKHARRAAALKASATGRRNRAWSMIHARIIERGRTQKSWRQIAMGIDFDRNVLAIFGTLPDPAAHVAEWDSGE